MKQGQKLLDRVLTQTQKWPSWVPVLTVSTICLLVWSLQTPQSEVLDNSQSRGPREAETVIPPGYVLVPIELSNASSFHGGWLTTNSLINLYSIMKDGERSKLLASAVKLIRAPLDPQQFGVLVPDTISKDIVRDSGPFLAVVLPKGARPSQLKSPRTFSVFTESEEKSE